MGKIYNKAGGKGKPGKWSQSKGKSSGRRPRPPKAKKGEYIFRKSDGTVGMDEAPQRRGRR
jgi:hypothetical protein